MTTTTNSSTCFLAETPFNMSAILALGGQSRFLQPQNASVTTNMADFPWTRATRGSMRTGICLLQAGLFNLGGIDHGTYATSPSIRQPRAAAMMDDNQEWKAIWNPGAWRARVGRCLWANLPKAFRSGVRKNLVRALGKTRGRLARKHFSPSASHHVHFQPRTRPFISMQQLLQSRLVQLGSM